MEKSGGGNATASVMSGLVHASVHCVAKALVVSTGKPYARFPCGAVLVLV